jgi:hypothetical protein
MIMRVINYNNIDQYTCSHEDKQQAYQYYSVGTPCYFTTVAVNNPNASVILASQTYTVTKANCYTSQFRLIPDKYISLISQLNTQTLQFPFVKVISNLCWETFTFPGNIVSVTKQAASRIDGLLITFHYHRSVKALCIQPYIENLKLTVEEAGNTTYPGGGI